MTLALSQTKATASHLRTEILIEASPATVWTILADTARYPEWNPFIRQVTGPLLPGARIRTVIQPLGKRAMTFRPTILRAEPGQELRWLGRLVLPGLFDGEHVFRLLPEGQATRLVHEETFRGLLARFVDPESFRTSFEALNLALKRRAEGVPVGEPGKR